jgi:hypothetical protein
MFILTIPHISGHGVASNGTEQNPEAPLKKVHAGRGTGRDCSVIEDVGWLGPIPSLQNSLSPGHFFLSLTLGQKKHRRGRFFDASNRQKPCRGSLERLSAVGFSHAHGAEICPPSAFSPLPKKCPGERQNSW